MAAWLAVMIAKPLGFDLFLEGQKGKGRGEQREVQPTFAQTRRPFVRRSCLWRRITADFLRKCL